MQRALKTTLLGLLALGATQLQAALPVLLHNDSKGQWVLQSTEAVPIRSTVTYISGGKITRTATFGPAGHEQKAGPDAERCTIHLFPGDTAVVVNEGSGALSFTLYDQYGQRVPELREADEQAYAMSVGAADLRLQIVDEIQLPGGGVENPAAWVFENRSVGICIRSTEGRDSFIGKKMTIFRDQF